MNKDERKALGVLYQCVNKITGMYPQNPANTQIIFKNAPLIKEASRYMLYGLSSLNQGILEDAKDDFTEALQILGKGT